MIEGPDSRSLFERDENVWAAQQIAALRDRRDCDLDHDNLIDVLQSLMSQTRREFRTHVTTLVRLLLRRQVANRPMPEQDNEAVIDQQGEIERWIGDVPSLAAEAQEDMPDIYRHVVRLLSIELDLPRDDFPAGAPWTFAEIMAMRGPNEEIS